jgi:hypothetical protein
MAADNVRSPPCDPRAAWSLDLHGGRLLVFRSGARKEEERRGAEEGMGQGGTGPPPWIVRCLPCREGLGREAEIGLGCGSG